MGINKVQYGNTVLIDLTDATATADQILQGYTAYGRDGSKLTGTATGGSGGVVYITDEIDENGGVIRNIITDEDATITDTLDANGGTVRSITGAEVYLQSVSVQPTESAQRVTPTGDYNALGSVNVGAIPSDYIGSAIEQRDSTDLTVSGATVTAPAGVYANSASKSVASGTLSNISIPTTAFDATISSSGVVAVDLDAIYEATPVSQSGYVETTDEINVFVYGTKNIQLPTRSSSDLTVSGATVTAPSGYYASNATKTVASGTEGTPIASKGAVSNHSVSVTPSVTNSAGYITGGTKTGTAVTVSASELVSGTKSITENGTGIDVASYASVDVNVPAQASLKATAVGGGTLYTIQIGTGSRTTISDGAQYSFSPNDSIIVRVVDGGVIYYNGVEKAKDLGGTISYTFSAPSKNLTITCDNGCIYIAEDAESWRLLASKDLTYSTTSTSSALIEWWDTGETAIWDYEVIYIKIRDKAGKRNGYFYGSDNYFLNRYISNGSASSHNDSVRFTIYLTSGTLTVSGSAGTTGYGVYALSIEDTGSIRLMGRYYSSYGTVDGTYSIEVYALVPPNGILFLK